MVNMSDTDWTPDMEDVIKKSRRTSSVWRYCEILDDIFARCNLCDHKLSYKSSVTNLRKHFKKKHPEVSMDPIERYNKNGLTIRDSSDSEDRNEIQRATKSVTIDYLRPAGEENRPRHTVSSVKNPSIVHTYSQAMKRERSPEKYDCRQNSKHARQSPGEEDEFDLFGRSITIQLKQMPLLQALELQAEITNIIMQKRIQTLRSSNEVNAACAEEQPVQYALVYAAAPTHQTEHELTIEEKTETTVEEGVVASG